MATTNHYAGSQITFTEAAAAATVTSTLPAPGAGLSWRIDNVSFFSGGAITAWNIEVTENGGTSCWKSGSTSAANPGTLIGPIATKANDAPKVILTASGAASCQLNVVATLVGSG